MLETDLGAPIGVDSSSFIGPSFTDLLHYQAYVLQAESYQIQKDYTKAIESWQETIKRWKASDHHPPAGLRKSMIVDITNQLIHCYLQVNDKDGAWVTYELGLDLERQGRDMIESEATDDPSMAIQQQRLLDQYDSARADAEILKQKILTGCTTMLSE